MKISIFGLGYVGCVSLGCLAQNGHRIIGVDINPTKVNLINQGKPTIVEKDIDKIIEEQQAKGNIYATTDYKESVLSTDISIICVGTPATQEGHLNLDYVYNTAKQIGAILKEKNTFHIIVIRSTVLPGTNIKVGAIIERKSDKMRNKDFAVVSNPEFLREGSAVEDYYNPPVTVIGSDNGIALDVMADIYSKVNGPIEKVDIKVAELIKYVNNSYHALKIVFANEIGNICKKIGIDSQEVMRLFCMDKQLNISSYYFKPGFAYGGSCLPKDLKALKTLAHDSYIELPLLNSIEKSNEEQKDIAYKIIIEKGKKKIGIFGISFKPGTDDLRQSPIVEIVEKLIGKGYEIRIFDQNVNVSKLIGMNKSYIEEHLPHLSSLLSRNMQEVADWADVIVLTNKEKVYKELKVNKSKTIVDLVRYPEFMNNERYNGICW
ncbi:MAG: UDP-glucose/GDP-mannose dehydrogenase family protein [Bacteroidales bacterium]|nr:UDP-glucose/GDP-mannose dehydrogenase family protein [Bacteroidales bacterium]